MQQEDVNIDIIRPFTACESPDTNDSLFNIQMDSNQEDKTKDLQNNSNEKEKNDDSHTCTNEEIPNNATDEGIINEQNSIKEEEEHIGDKVQNGILEKVMDYEKERHAIRKKHILQRRKILKKEQERLIKTSKVSTYEKYNKKFKIELRFSPTSEEEENIEDDDDLERISKWVRKQKRKKEIRKKKIGKASENDPRAPHFLKFPVSPRIVVQDVDKERSEKLKKIEEEERERLKRERPKSTNDSTTNLLSLQRLTRCPLYEGEFEGTPLRSSRRKVPSKEEENVHFSPIKIKPKKRKKKEEKIIDPNSLSKVVTMIRGKSIPKKEIRFMTPPIDKFSYENKNVLRKDEDVRWVKSELNPLLQRIEKVFIPPLDLRQLKEETKKRLSSGSLSATAPSIPKEGFKGRRYTQSARNRPKNDVFERLSAPPSPTRGAGFKIFTPRNMPIQTHRLRVNPLYATMKATSLYELKSKLEMAISYPNPMSIARLPKGKIPKSALIVREMKKWMHDFEYKKDKKTKKKKKKKLTPSFFPIGDTF